MPRRTSPNSSATTPLDPAEVSETIRAFARPLLYLDPAGPADLETLRTAMLLAMMCWNLPVYEATNSRLHTHTKQALVAALELVSAPVRACLRQLIADRRTKFNALMFPVIVEVHGSSLADAQIVAQAKPLPQKTVS